MTVLKRHPALFSLFSLIVIYCFNKIPLSNILILSGYNEFKSNAIEKIIFNCIVSFCIYIIIVKQKIPFSLNNKTYNGAAYYLPAILYIVIFSGGFRTFQELHFCSISSSIIFLYGFKVLSAAFLEEILFRGLILGLLLHRYYQIKNGALKSIIFSGLIFGCIHILNLWSDDGQSLKGVFNQIYAATGLGVMYGAIYLKTRSIIVLAILHFLSNFFAGVGELEIGSILEHRKIIESSILNSILTEFFRIFIFGIPLLIGLFVIRQVDKSEIEVLLKPQ